MPTRDLADSYGEDELLERLRNFDSDSPYEVGLIAAAVKRIEDLETQLDNAWYDMKYSEGSE